MIRYENLSLAFRRSQMFVEKLKETPLGKFCIISLEPMPCPLQRFQIRFDTGSLQPLSSTKQPAHRRRTYLPFHESSEPERRLDSPSSVGWP